MKYVLGAAVVVAMSGTAMAAGANDAKQALSDATANQQIASAIPQGYTFGNDAITHSVGTCFVLKDGRMIQHTTVVDENGGKNIFAFTDNCES